MRILTRITASSGLDVSSAGVDTITLGNSSEDKIIFNAPIVSSVTITGSAQITGSLFINGLQITSSAGATLTTGNITGSGTTENPIDLKTNISLTSVTASYLSGSGLYLTNIPNTALDNSALYINDQTASLGTSVYFTTGSNLSSSQTGNTFRVSLKDNISLLSVSASFYGNGTEITNLTASHIDNFVNDVRAQFSAGTNITINNGIISSSGGGISAITSSGNLTGSGVNGSPVTLKDNISLTSVTASFSGNGANITNITASNITNFANDVKAQTTIAGTTSQVLVNGGTAAASGSVTLSLPQSIATTSSPTFAAPIATTGYRLGTTSTYGIDVISLSTPVVARATRLISGSNAGLSYTGDYVAIGTLLTTSGILLSSSANIINSSPNVAVSGTFNANNANFYGTLRATGSSTTVVLQPNSTLTASAPNMMIGDPLSSNNNIGGFNLLLNGAYYASLMSQNLFVGFPRSAEPFAYGKTTIEASNIDISGSVKITGSLTVNGVSITGSSGGGGGGSTAYDIAGQYSGKPLASETIFRFMAVRSYDLSLTSANHYLNSAITSSNSKTFSIYRDATLVGDISFGSNDGVGSVTINSASFTAGQLLSIVAPSTQDATLADLYFTFKADTV
jgi:hypothetical protein